MTQSPDTSSDKLRKQLESELLSLLSKAAPYPTKPVYLGEYLDEIMKLFQAHIATVELEARIDEMKRLNLYYLQHDGEGEHKLAAQFDKRLEQLEDQKGKQTI